MYRLWLLAALVGFAFLGRAYGQENTAKDRSAWAEAPHRVWYEQQMMNPAARERLSVPFKSCCDNGDVFRTRFQLIQDGSKYGTETYQYWKDERWHTIPADIIQHKPTPDGQPVLFIHKATGKELCFIIDREGI